MLICPECQSGNPDSNKFCQHCGTSLIYTNCHNCGAEISLIALECEHCQNPHAKKLIALVASDSTVNSPPKLVSNLATHRDRESTQSSREETVPSLWKIEQQYLDPQQRYYLDTNSDQELSDTFPNSWAISVIATQVMDKFPLKESYLDELKKNQQDLFTDLGQKLDNSYLSVRQYWNTIGIPTVALPYLTLRHYTPVIPPVYDAWQDRDLGVLLLSDRSSWQLLTDLWSNTDVPWEQVLWSLNETIKYWTPLTKTGCTRTLLVKDNLRVDEDQSLGFKQLYLDRPEEKPTLADLARKWHQWFNPAILQQNPELETIFQKTIAEEIETVEDFRQALYTLADSSVDFLPAAETTELALDLNTDDLLDRQQNSFNFAQDGIDSILYEDSAEDMPTTSLAMQIASVTEASCTDVGTQRDHNEDFFGTKTTLTQEENPRNKQVKVQGLYIVCDGMGGHSAGEVASAMAVETIQSYFYTYWQDELPDEETIKDGILLANRTIYQTNVDHERSGNGMMGTTLVMALLQDNNLAIAHVGDSRIYRLTRSHGLEQLTQDHEVGQREINRGIEPEIAYGRPDAYQLTQALGPRENKYIKPAIEFLDIQEDCLLLLCSDGLSDNDLIEKHWKTYLQPLISSSADLQSGLFKLIDFADRYNGHDNITGILLRIKLQPNFET